MWALPYRITFDNQKLNNSIAKGACNVLQRVFKDNNYFNKHAAFSVIERKRKIFKIGLIYNKFIHHIHCFRTTVSFPGLAEHSPEIGGSLFIGSYNYFLCDLLIKPVDEKQKAILADDGWSMGNNV